MESELFAWDDDKSAKNQEKHGMDFAVGILILESSDRTEFVSSNPGNDDERRPAVASVTIPNLGHRMLPCAYTVRDGRSRIISVRRAREKEIAAHVGRAETR